MDFELRELKASDMGAVCKILSGIGAKKFKDCFSDITVKSKKDVEALGVSIAFDIGGIIVENIPSAQKDIDTFIASLTGMKVEEVQELPFADYGELIFTIIAKEEFRDFFARAMKLFNP